MNVKELFEKATAVWGEGHKIGMMQEEAAEVIQVLNKWRRGIAKEDDICSELADLQIMLDQMYMIFPVDKIKKARACKLSRLDNILKQYGNKK